jgi:hypothetical protein
LGPSIQVLTLTVQAAEPLVAGRFVSVTCGVPALGAACYGVARSAAAAGQLVPVDAMGSVPVETGDEIPAGSAIQTDAQGRAIPLDSGVKLGRMAPGQVAATAAGQRVEVMLHPN